ncbi:MAG: TIGR04283 family arsenosugar biosynthesis glycosyltransferase [Hyphomonadaceae bacterium]|nr:TIGR04283 family arsenosugar biosynthesis glycosyltransferase [Hyphomonadaceae bacterium]
MISVIIPTLNAAAPLPRALSSLYPAALEGIVREVIVSDGGSHDPTLAMAEEAGCEIVAGEKGRAAQMIRGAAAARGRWLLFLHADTGLEEGWSEEALRFLNAGDERRAAAFRFAFDDASFAASWIAFWVGVRCATLKLPYGDQGLLISRTFYNELGGLRDLPLMEDVDLVRRVGPARLAMLKSRAFTSAEKYRRDGYARRAMRNLGLITRYLMGADPAKLAREYD